MPPPLLADVEAEVVSCRRCPRLVAWREQVATERRAAYRDEDYWARPLPAFGDPAARLVLVGLAPAAHGGNRTGRMFTGDRSGDFLYAALYRAGYASAPLSVSRHDGLELRDAFVTAAVRCAPPQNRPTPEERDTCSRYLVAELALLHEARVLLVLGGFALDALWRVLRPVGPGGRPAPRPRFAHGLEVPLDGGAGAGDGAGGGGAGGAGDGADERPGASAGTGRTLLCSYHPSQQNTFTGRLTPEMLEEVLARARELCAAAPEPPQT